MPDVSWGVTIIIPKGVPISLSHPKSQEYGHLGDQNVRFHPRSVAMFNIIMSKPLI